MILTNGNTYSRTINLNFAMFQVQILSSYKEWCKITDKY